MPADSRRATRATSSCARFMRALLLGMAAVVAVVAGLSPAAHAYTLNDTRWYTSTVTMQLQLGAAPSPLLDGSTSWGESAEDALAIWNQHISATRFNVVRDSTATKAGGNRQNNVFFSDNIYGDAWGTGVLAVTITYSSSGSQNTETDVLFNSAIKWDSYRGALRWIGGSAVYDFHRVALHEFGHALGLDHPDQAGQSVVALMNSRITSLDSLTQDDVNGAQALYGSPGPTAPLITTQPASQTVAAGSSVTFSVVASSTLPFNYQWRKNGVAIAGATGSTLVLTAVTSASSGDYSVIVTSSAGSTASATASLTVTSPATIAPTITTQPLSQTVRAGNAVTFAVSATGTPAPSYEWYKDGVPISAASAATHTIPATRTSDAGTYTVRVRNSAGLVTSAGATLIVQTPPALITAPYAQFRFAGDRITLRVEASGNPAPTYQWKKDGTNIGGATSAEFVIPSASPADAGNYTVVITNTLGSTTTSPTQVEVRYSVLANLSARGLVPSGGALTAGFVLRGTTDKPVLARGIGPALEGFGVSGSLVDPVLSVNSQSSGQALAMNDTWSQVSQNAATFQSVGAFPLPASSADAAVSVTLPSGGYTSRITPRAATASGVALAEIYDTDLPNYRSRLVNLSTLGFTGSAENALVAGISVHGTAPKRVLVRAVGPTLVGYGVDGAIANPKLEVYLLGTSTPIASNDDWAGTSELKEAFAAAGAFNLPDASRDSAIVLSLLPGGYTIVVTGVNGTTGKALVEIYDIESWH